MIFHQNKTVEHFHIGSSSSGISSSFSGIFTPYIEPKEPVRRLPLRVKKASQVFSNDRSLNLRAYLQTSATAFAYPCSLVFLTLRISTT